MSPSNKKRVHYAVPVARSRDSALGSSSRASLGAADFDNPFDPAYYNVAEQRKDNHALQEALNAANERIRVLKEANADLDKLLSRSNEEKRKLRKQNADVLQENDDLRAENERLKKRERERSPKATALVASPGPSSSSIRRMSTTTRPSSSELPTVRTRAPGEERSTYRSSSTAVPPSVPQPPSAPNPFAPNAVAYSRHTAPVMQEYSVPIRTIAAPRGSNPEDLYPTDGLYHPYPLR